MPLRRAYSGSRQGHTVEEVSVELESAAQSLRHRGVPWIQSSNPRHHPSPPWLTRSLVAGEGLPGDILGSD